ncbi:MAG: hypothetical protein AAB368_15905 [bacterium]
MSGASEFGKDLGVVHEAVVTGRKAGWGREEWAKLAHDEVLMRSLLLVINGNGEATNEMITHVIDCSVQPMIPTGWQINPKDQIASRFQGELVWSLEKIRLHLDPAQEGDGVLKGNALKKKLKGQPVLPANVLDWLLQHPAFIPSDWRGKAIFFWGTVYRGSGGDLCVRCLCWGDRSWDWSGHWLSFDWDGRGPAAVLAG